MGVFVHFAELYGKMSEHLFVNLAPVCYSGHVDGSGPVVNLVHDAVIADTNTPFFIAALEFLAARRPGNRREVFEARHNAGTACAGRWCSSLSALAVKATR